MRIHQYCFLTDTRHTIDDILFPSQENPRSRDYNYTGKV